MSKLDAQRAMREARYAARQAGTGDTPSSGTPARRTPAARPAVAPPAEATASTDDALCGHRNMSGRTCTRELGHSAKSHRYS